MVFGLFGVYWVMPLSIVGLFACWQCSLWSPLQWRYLDGCSSLFVVVHLEGEKL